MLFSVVKKLKILFIFLLLTHFRITCLLLRHVYSVRVHSIISFLMFLIDQQPSPLFIPHKFPLSIMLSDISKSRISQEHLCWSPVDTEYFEAVLIKQSTTLPLKAKYHEERIVGILYRINVVRNTSRELIRKTFCCCRSAVSETRAIRMLHTLANPVSTLICSPLCWTNFHRIVASCCPSGVVETKGNSLLCALYGSKPLYSYAQVLYMRWNKEI